DPVQLSHTECQNPDRSTQLQPGSACCRMRERAALVLLGRRPVGRGGVYLVERQAAAWRVLVVRRDPESLLDGTDRTAHERPIIPQVRCQQQWRVRQGNNFQKLFLVSCSLFSE